jgi:ubiquinone biosynthesis protein COQ4
MKKYFIPARLSRIQKLVLIPYFGLGSLVDPTRGDLVAGLGDVTAESALRNLYQLQISTPEGKLLFQRKPLITSELVTTEMNDKLSVDSLGYSYYNFMAEHDFFHKQRTIVRFIEDPELAYLMARYRQIHDFLHVICNLPPTVLGEIALKWLEIFYNKYFLISIVIVFLFNFYRFEWKLTGLPVCLLSGILGPIKLSIFENIMLTSTYIPWAIRSAKNSDIKVLSYMYEENLEKSLHNIQSELSIEPAPKWTY